MGPPGEVPDGGRSDQECAAGGDYEYNFLVRRGREQRSATLAPRGPHTMVQGA